MWYVVLCIASLVAFASCSLDGLVASTDDLRRVDAYFPLKLGRTWTYAYVDSDMVIQPGSFRIDTVTEADSNRFRVETRHIENGQGYGTDTRTYLIADSSIWLCAADLSYCDAVMTVPVVQGATLRGSRCSVQSADTTIETPAGTFAGIAVVREYAGGCIRRSGRNTYYAPAIGPVKFEYFDDWEGRRFYRQYVLIALNG